MDHVLVVFMLLWGSGLQADESETFKEIDDIRLVGESSNCSGELQVKHQGVWKAVREEYDWNLKLADVVCRHLDCGSVVQASLRTGSYSPSHSITPSCLNSGSTLRKCLTKRAPAPPPILEIICSDSVRLVNGTSLCSGRLEVKSNQSWSSVCEDDFDQQDAEVVCRELGCGTHSVLQGALYGEVESPMWTKEFQCGGRESTLFGCRNSASARNTCSSGKAVGLTCSEPETVRLVRGSSRCDGELEVKQQGEWHKVDDKMSLWNLKTADIVCRQLDCGSVVSTGWKKLNYYTRVWSIRSTCLQSNSAVRECVLIPIDSSNLVLEVKCSESVRLVNGNSLCSGRLEVKSNQLWSSVCEDDFDQQDAEVVCRELGCGIPSVLQGGLYGEVVSPMWSKELRCEGNESALLDCRTSDSARTSCLSGKAVGLTCSEPDDVRLVEGASPCVGTFEMKHKGVWKPVAVDIFSNWDLMSAAVVCKQLDCGSALSTGGTSYVFHPEAWIITSSCGQSESAIRECALIWSDQSTKNLEIFCSDSVRLVNGNSLCSGRLEVKYEQLWSSVCEDDFSQPDAEVVCRELGCGAPSALQGVLYGDVETRNKYQCRGHESALLDCDSYGSVTNTCLRGKAVGLTCSEPDNVRLFGGTSRCHGTFEMKQRGEWTPVADWIFGWDKKLAPAVCERLDCGSAVSTNILPSSHKDRLRLRYSCVDSGSILRECLSQVSLKSGISMEVICSDLLVQPNISFSTHTDGVSEAKQQGFHVPKSSNYTITCSTEPQFPGGYFQLIFTTSATSQNYTLLAVNHSAHFLFLAADHTHQGDYRCVYHIHVFSHNFSAESRPLHLTVADLLVQPKISFSTHSDGVSEAKQQGFQVLMSSDFTITCSTEPQFPGGSFQLIFTTSATSQNYTLPAVDHSAHFLFLAADHTHQGDYRCVYHIYVFSHNFSAESRPFHLTVVASLTDLIFRLGVLLLTVMCGAALFFYYKATRGQKPNPENNIELDYLGGDEDGLDEEAGAQTRE